MGEHGIATLVALALVGLSAFILYQRRKSTGKSSARGTAVRSEVSPAPGATGKDFAGQVAIITGGGTGLGRAIALNLARRGASVVLASRTAEHLNSTAAEIEALGGVALAIPMDVREPEQVDAMLRQTMEKFGKVDILVNNAARNFLIPAEKLTPHGWKAVIGI